MGLKLREVMNIILAQNDDRMPQIRNSGYMHVHQEGDMDHLRGAQGSG